MTCEKPQTGEPTTQAQGAPLRFKQWLLLACPVLLLAAGLRFYGINIQSLRDDEAITLAAATGHFQSSWQAFPPNVVLGPPAPDPTAMRQALPWWVLWKPLSGDVHPPLYYQLLRLWRDLWGDGTLAARGFSALASIIAVGLLFELGRLLYGNAAGFWAALIMAVAVPQVAFGQELRSYTLLLAFALGAAVALLRIEKFGLSRRRLLSLGGCALAVALTHYFGIGALVAMGIYALLKLRGAARRQTLLAFAVAGGLFLILAGPLLLAQRHNTVQPWLAERHLDHVSKTFWRLLSLPGHLLSGYDQFHDWHTIDFNPGLAHLLGLLSLLPVLFIWWRRNLWLPLLWLCCVPAPLLILDLTRSTAHLSYTRYLLLAGPAVYLLASAALRDELWRHVLPALVVACIVYDLPKVYQPYKTDWRSLASYIRDQGSADEPLVFHMEDQPWFPRALYAAIAHYGGAKARAVVFLDDAPPPQCRAQLAGKRLWLVTSSDAPAETALPGCRIEDSGIEAALIRVRQVSLPAGPPSAATPPE